MKALLSTILLLITGILYPHVSLAQSPHIRIEGKDKSKEVSLKSLDIQIEVVDKIATTTMLLVFHNNTSRVLEGELVFPLPEGVSVSHFALDINGKMRDAVPVDKAKGTQVFEEIEQRRVDPGLLERVEGNNFRVRIYPIPANGSRSIRIGYEQTLSPSQDRLTYKLPMDYEETIAKFNLKATVYQADNSLRIEGEIPNQLTFDKQGNAYIAQLSRENYKPDALLSFSLPYKPYETRVFMQPASGSYYFLANCTPESKPVEKVWSDTLGLIWDVSYSGRGRNHEADFSAIEALVKQKQNLCIQLILLNHLYTVAGTYTIKGGNWTELQEALNCAIYDGGTNFQAIDLDKLSYKEYLFFSDGLSTLSSADFLSEKMNKSGAAKKSHLPRIHTFASSAMADYNILQFIAGKTGGKFFNLTNLSPQEIQKEMRYESLLFLGFKENTAIREVCPSLSTPVGNNFSIAGISSQANTELVLLFGYGNTPAFEQKLILNAEKQANTNINIHRVWAQKKIAELDLDYEKNRTELAEIGMEFGIITRNTSLLVLETLDDYIRYQVSPPEELQTEYLRWKKNDIAAQEREQGNLLQKAVSSSAELKSWWLKDFVIKEPKYPKPNSNNNTSRTPAPAPAVDVPFEQQIIDESSIRLRTMEFTEDKEMIDASKSMESERRKSVVVKQKSGSPSQYVAQNQAQISLTPIKQDKEYLKGLTGRLDEDYASYLRLRETYGTTPDFFIDLANWFRKEGDPVKALSILSCIAELEIENASLFRLLGYKFKEFKEYIFEEYVCKKVAEWRPMEPQSYRDYALALADNGDYQKALDQLYMTLSQQYTNTINRTSTGIEEVIVTEVNNLATLYKTLNTKNITNGILIGPIPVDIRVVINWNMNHTDIDLHLVDPRGERCFYSNRNTSIGGRLSYDVTRGYGPEQFMLKRAIRGKYKVLVNYFGDTRVNADGPATILVEIYTSYSDKSQKREIVCLQLNQLKTIDKDSSLVQVAEFDF